jgi:glycosyltransferase involved in cell wall biosynthesis
MARRKLLLVTYHFPPSAASGSFRMLGFARHLPRFGWDPVVVAPPLGAFDPADEDLANQVPPGVEVCRVPYPRGVGGWLLRRFAPNGLWLPRALAACGRAIREHRPAAVFTSSPPHCVHLVGRLLKVWHRLPWVADFRDPWVATTPRATSGAPWDRWEAFCERGVVAAADAVLANAPRACAALQDAFPPHADKVVTLTNGFDPDAFPRHGGRGHDGPLTLLHAGEVYAGRDPRPLLDALGNLRRRTAEADRPIRLHFLGQVTVNRCDLPVEVKRRGLDSSVTVERQVSYRESLARMAQADLLLLLDAPGRRIGVPAKVYEYLGAGRPILALAEPDGDTAWALRESGAVHRIVAPGDAFGIERALRELVRVVTRGEEPAPARERVAAFTREHLARSLAGILDGCLAPAAAGAARVVCGVVGNQ